MSQVPLTIEDLLIAQGTLTAAQVSQVKLENINSGKPIDQIILERKLVPEAAIIQAKAQLLGLPFITVSGRPISPEVLNLVPESAARRYNLIPFDKDLTSVSVAMFDPLDL
jgi:hypothetical protein